MSLVKTIKVKKSIFLPPQYYDEHIYEHIYSLLLSKYLGKCEEENGVFLDILDINVLDNKIGNNCSYTEFFVEMTAKVAKPEKNAEFNFIVESIQESGIYGVVEKKIKIGVSHRYMNGWSYSLDEKNEPSFKKDDKKIVIGDDIKVRIVLSRFSIDKIACICELIE